MNLIETLEREAIDALESLDQVPISISLGMFVAARQRAVPAMRARGADQGPAGLARV